MSDRSGSRSGSHRSDSRCSGRSRSKSRGRDRNRGRDIRNSNHHNRDSFHREKREDFSRQSRTENGDDHSHNNYKRSPEHRDRHRRSPSRERDAKRHGSSRNNYSPNPRSQKFPRSRSPERSSRVKRSRSPPRFVNRSPPRHSQHERSRRSSPPRNTKYSSRNRSDYSPNRVPRNPEMGGRQYGKFDKPANVPDTEKLARRVKEYLPWLTTRKASIFESGLNQKLKGELDDIDWCLDVIQDINSNEIVGTHTLTIAQDKIISLTSKDSNTLRTTAKTVQEKASNIASHLESTHDKLKIAQATDLPDFSGILPFLRQSSSTSQIESSQRCYTSPLPPPSNTAILNVESSKDMLDFASSKSPILKTKTEEVNRVRNYSNQERITPEPEQKIFDYGHGKSEDHDTLLDETLFERRKGTLNCASVDLETKSRTVSSTFNRNDDWDSESMKTNQSRLYGDLLHENPPCGKTVSVPPIHPWSDKMERTRELNIPNPNFFTNEVNLCQPHQSHHNITSLPIQQPQQQFPAFQNNQFLPQTSQIPGTLNPLNVNPNILNPFLNSAVVPAAQLLFQRQAQQLIGLQGVGIPNLLPIDSGRMANNAGFSGTAPNARPSFKSENNALPAGRETDEIMMARIKARAAQSFNNRNNTTRPQFPNNPTSTWIGSNVAPASSSTDSSSSAVMDPRLKPRGQRHFVAEPFPISKTKDVKTKTITTYNPEPTNESSDSDSDQLKIDLSPQTTSVKSPTKLNGGRSPSQEELAIEWMKAKKARMAAEEAKSIKPTSSSQDLTSSRPAIADDVIKSLLYNSLSAEEAEVLNSNEDYLRSTLARVKEELNSKAKDLKSKGDSMESHVSSTTFPVSTTTNSESDGSKLIRKKPESKRVTNPLEIETSGKVIVESSISPRQRRSMTKTANHTGSSPDKVLGSVTSSPKLSPVVVLEKCSKYLCTNTDSKIPIKKEPKSPPLRKKRKYTMRKRKQKIRPPAGSSVSVAQQNPGSNKIVLENLSLTNPESTISPVVAEGSTEPSENITSQISDTSTVTEQDTGNTTGVKNTENLDSEDFRTRDVVVNECCLQGFTDSNLVNKPNPPPEKILTAANRIAGTGILRIVKKKKSSRGLSAEFECTLCAFSGTTRKIVEHYVNEHPGITIPPACLPEQCLKSFMEKNSSNSPQLMEITYTVKSVIKCLFCNIRIKNLSRYSEHLTCHTGEYLFKCSQCNLKFFSKELVYAHCSSHCKTQDKAELAGFVVEIKQEPGSCENEFYCYMCRECNYFQIQSENIRQHLDLTKHSETDVICIKFGYILNKQSTNFKLPSRATRSLKSHTATEQVIPAPALLEPLQELLKSVFNDDHEMSLLQIPKITPDAVSRYSRPRRTGIDSLFENFKIEQWASEPLEESAHEQDPILELESNSDRILASEEAVNWLVDTICCNEEMETEVSSLANIVVESEATFNFGLAKIDGTLSLRSSIDESASEEESDESDEEPNDFYVDEVISDAETEEGESDVFDINEAALNNIVIKMAAEIPSTSASTNQAFPTNSMDSLNVDSISLQQTPEDTDILVCDLQGRDLYRCGNLRCGFSSQLLQAFKAHSATCPHLDPSRGHACAHCPKQLKSLPAFYEHINRHGKYNATCSVCPFNARTPSEMKKHFKTHHKCNCVESDCSSSLKIHCDALWFPKEVYEKRIDLQFIQSNLLLFVPRIQYLPNETEDIPKSCIMLSDIYCALCSYATKVRTNMIRHLDLHKRAEMSDVSIVIPKEAGVNAVPCRERKTLMFNRMSNWAGSTQIANHTKSEVKEEKVEQVREDESQSKDNTARWKCASCKVVVSSWEAAKNHIQAIHKVQSQFMCSCCGYHSDSIIQLAKHIASKECVKAGHKFSRPLVYFSRSELAEENIRYPIWRRASSRDHLRGIYFIHENDVEIEPEDDPLKPFPEKKESHPTKRPLQKSNVKTAKRMRTARASNLGSELIEYNCCQCGTYKSKTPEGMKTHLRQHLNYHRFTCKICGNRSWTMDSFKLHVEADHRESYCANKHLHTEPLDMKMEAKLDDWMSVCTRPEFSLDDDDED